MSGEILPELQGLSQGFFVHEFYFGPKGDTLCKTRNAHGRELPAHHLPNEGSCIFCLKRRTQGKNKLMHLAFAQALHKPVHVEAVGIHALKRGEQAAQYQILAVIKAAFVQREHAVPFRDKAERIAGALRIGTDRAGVSGRKPAAARAEVQIVAQVVDAAPKTPCFGFRPFEQGHGGPHGGFGAKARQTRKLLYQGLERFGNPIVHGSRKGRAA